MILANGLEAKFLL